MADSYAQALRQFAEGHLAETLNLLPGDPIRRFILFIEVVRAMDYWGTHSRAMIGDNEEKAQSLDLMYWGWNRAVAELFRPLEKPGAFHLMESTHESRSYAASLMQEFGKVSLLRRIADMSDRGIMKITQENGEFHIRMDNNTRAQFADLEEFDRLKVAEVKLSSLNAGWKMTSARDALRFPGMPGNYIALDDPPVERWIRPDIEELIKPLVRPWNTGRGIMVAYGARIEVDKHYMAEALALATLWREGAGIDPKAKLGSFTGADMAAVGAALISLHSKHFGCVSVAKTLFPQVSVPQSLTIWGPRDELEESISVISGLSLSIVQSVFDTMAMTSEQAKKLAEHSTPLIPVLFDLGNGLILRPVSCLTRNPFTAARNQHQWLEPRTANAIAADREDWMREHLYAMFGGRRYICFPGNLKLRRKGTVLTDIDAAVYDRVSGEVGLFQLKWQDYSTNDVRQLRSKATNLSAELTDWSGRVRSWIEENDFSELAKSLQLKIKRGEKIKSVLLFAISKSSVRTHGYGVRTDAPYLAMAVWPQFARARMEIGPSEMPLRDIHTRLLEEYGQIPNIYPMPASITVAKTILHVYDFWNRTDRAT